MEDSPSSPPLSPNVVSQEASGWGWGGWRTSAFSVISDFQKVATEAVEEISKNALAAAKDAAKGVSELQNSVTDPLNSPTKEESNEDADPVNATTEEMEPEPESPQDELRRVALLKLEEAGQDSALGHGLKAIDSSVENLASGAWEVLGNAWRGSRKFVEKLEHSAENLVETLQKQGSFTHKAGTLAPNFIEGGKAITAKGLEVLEYVGRETVDLIASETGIEVEEDPKQSDRDTLEEDEHYIEDVNFDRCFYIYGGPEQLEELEALANHYMLLCNRAKAKLPSEHKYSLELDLKQLQNILSLGLDGFENAPEVDKGKRVETVSLGDVNELKTLRESGVAKAAEMAAGFTVALGGLAMAEIVQKTTDRLEAIRAEGVHRLSELCASGISQLLALGKSVLVSSSDQDNDNSDNVNWPKDCVEKARIIRAQAQAMAGDIEAVSDSFVTGIGDVTAAFQAVTGSESVVHKEDDKDDVRHELMRKSSIEDKAHTLSSDLENDGSTAVEKVQVGLQHLVFVLLSTSLKN